MHLTLHLTDSCNLNCRYCYVRQSTHFMAEQTVYSAVDLAASLSRKRNDSCGIIFFGGEPLLCRELIEKAVAYAEDKQKNGEGRFHYKITTNGTLLDESFMRFSKEHEIFIAMSHDGIKKAHDCNRVDHMGDGTFDCLEEKARLLLSYRPYAPVMMTVSPNTVKYYSDGVEYLYTLGFRYLICTLDYSGSWTQAELNELERQYLRLSEWYLRKTEAEEKFYFSPFEVKISSHIHKDNYCSERCELGKKQLSVSPSGDIYPCVQFIGDEKYRIGSVSEGIDEKKRLSLYRLNEEERDTCRDCAIRNRCNHWCACLNKQATGDMRTVSPVLCAHERVVLPITDKLAEKLYKSRSGMFIQKHYNDMYPLLSFTEDIQQ